MGKADATGEGQLSLPLGGLMYEAYRNGALDEFPAPKSLDAMRDSLIEVWSNKPELRFMHSMLCSMALPVQEPADPSAPVVKQNGDSSLIIQPLITQDFVEGELTTVCHGIPYGRHARMILYYIMTEAVYCQSREIVLGDNFSDWCRRMGLNAKSGGKRGTRTMIAEQMRRIMSCQWTFRTDRRLSVAENGTIDKSRAKKGASSLSAFSVQEMKIANQYAGLRSSQGEFVTHFMLTEEFYDHLLGHSVPLNDRAMAALSNSAIQMDLYCWLCARLPRIPVNETVRISWDSFFDQMGSTAGTRSKRRQTIREVWQVVSAVYPEARNSVDFGTRYISLKHAERPAKGRLTVIGKDNATAGKASVQTADGEDLYANVTFPKSGIHFVEPFASIGKAKGSNNCLLGLAERFREAVGPEIETLSGKRLVHRWTKFCESVPPPR